MEETTEVPEFGEPLRDAILILLGWENPLTPYSKEEAESMPLVMRLKMFCWRDPQGYIKDYPPNICNDDLAFYGFLADNFDSIYIEPLLSAPEMGTYVSIGEHDGESSVGDKRERIRRAGLHAAYLSLVARKRYELEKTEFEEGAK